MHAADLHLDSPLRGLSRLGDSELAATLRSATRRACENLVDAVVDEQADALLVAGDVYDGDWKDYATGAFFVRQLSRLHDEGIPVFLINGNHDAESEITRSLRLPPNTHRLSVDAPESVVLDDLGLAVHGQGFARRAVLENLVPAYPDRIPGLVNVGMLHTSVQGDDRHDTYAPCRPEDLSGCGYEYFALGHVHEQRPVCDGPHQAWFSGNLQGRHPQERGPKGALLVDAAPGRWAAPTPLVLDVARWELVEVDIAGLADADEVFDAVGAAIRERCVQAAPRAVVAQVTLCGAGPAAAGLTDTERVRTELELAAESAGAVLEKIRNRIRPTPEALTVDPELTAAVSSAAAELAGEPGRIRELAAPLEREVGRRLREAGLLDLRDDERLAALARQAEQQLLARMAGESS
ncbi:DNA repair exonuclease family protein YhaO [Pseudonocardia sp. Ae168_Ps1]|uniref:metallophosphoesterase family protein n=1 Tax=unclassified Pseudonocardia TaxID=2619320 RepID=UPI00095F375E|nr:MULTISPECIES: DNA repair exonuclease [unclassified Pseudonocardia]OLL71847.1 DNA repair exonuclease family protein YhaO [Pseudonocardia sp. Ae150A_Ps1]OLL77815.1 DNA repair exonuclease family protein YhaO [Pseudonocardia sp. Ae168_Ps1]OLL88061.1 DNA repair exonuclease family protein YhaO [Pseudonocardia sp. Ae263_Ps1]OLL91913.1 DNA repair exonuclease family protein YhaO [Pseudonocardia sp. Ae356_Ps1]